MDVCRCGQKHACTYRAYTVCCFSCGHTWKITVKEKDETVSRYRHPPYVDPCIHVCVHGAMCLCVCIKEWDFCVSSLVQCVTTYPDLNPSLRTPSHHSSQSLMALGVNGWGPLAASWPYITGHVRGCRKWRVIFQIFFSSLVVSGTQGKIEVTKLKYVKIFFWEMSSQVMINVRNTCAKYNASATKICTMLPVVLRSGTVDQDYISQHVHLMRCVTCIAEVSLSMIYCLLILFGDICDIGSKSIYCWPSKWNCSVCHSLWAHHGVYHIFCTYLKLSWKTKCIFSDPLKNNWHIE